MKYNNFLNDSDISTREISLDPINTRSGSIIDDGTDVVEYYNAANNSIEKFETITNLRINLKNIIDNKKFKSLEELKEFNKKLIKDIDELLLNY